MQQEDRRTLLNSGEIPVEQMEPFNIVLQDKDVGPIS
jgi:hypothetical protein